MTTETDQPKPNSPWRERLGFYRNKKAITFPNREERTKALHLVWHDDELFGLPRNHADGYTLIVPLEAVEIFRRKGVLFEVFDVVPAYRPLDEAASVPN